MQQWLAMAGLWLLVTATAREAALLTRRVTGGCVFEDAPRDADYLLWRAKAYPLAVVATGAGAKATEQGILRALADLKPVDAVIGFGFAGGLTKTAATEDLVVPARIFQGREEQQPTDWLRMSILSKLEKSPLKTLLTSGKLVCSPVEKAALFAATGAEAVDMESAVWGTVARGEDIAWAVVRAVLDTADEALPESFAFLSDRFGRARWEAAIPRLLFRPNELRAVLRIRREMRQAAPALTAALKSWLNP